MTLEKVTGKGFKAKILGKEYLVQFYSIKKTL